MKLQIICVGKLAADWQQQSAADYLARLRRYFSVELVELKEAKAGRKAEAGELVKREGEQIIKRIAAAARVIILDEEGHNPRSMELADQLQQEMLHGGRSWCLVIGGPYGLAAEVRARADSSLSLSRLTLTHQMARVLLLEQLYRAATIINNEPYHNR